MEIVNSLHYQPRLVEAGQTTGKLLHSNQRNTMKALRQEITVILSNAKIGFITLSLQLRSLKWMHLYIPINNNFFVLPLKLSNCVKTRHFSSFIHMYGLKTVASFPSLRNKGAKLLITHSRLVIT